MQQQQPQQHDASPKTQKRIRVLLSCAPCRNSKLKCDRQQPCGQCDKKARADQCVYAPKPTSRKKKPAAKNMTARLKRLEGLVRDMMGEDKAPQEVPSLQGHVVRGEKGTAYVGATHCMAMLEDIGDLKMYFDEEDDDADSRSDDLDVSEMLLGTRGPPGSRDELVAQLPERHVADRLITRYFASMSPSQHIIHKPTFTRMYAQFWQDPSSVTMQWLAQLFMMLTLGTFFNNFTAPHELSGDSAVPVVDRIKHYRSCAGLALVWSKYTQPTNATLPAFLLYVESHFLLNRAAQMNCYVLSGVCIRLLLKMGLHRDPSKLPANNMSPFEGEMRRRIWNMAVQIDTLVSFHMGLPSMLQGIETDTRIPSNIQDEDFDESSAALPPERPPRDHTHMTYPINKSRILRVFGHIARQAHSLTPPTYADVCGLDQRLNAAWAEMPAVMAVRPLDECVGDSPTLLVQRFGLQALYNKCRCVLHRRYLAEAVPVREHSRSRQQCLEAAVGLLEQQHTIWVASKPGGVMSSTSWFLSSLAVHDYLLAAMIVYLVITNERYPDPDAGFDFEGRKPSKEELTGMLRRSWVIWTEVSENNAELRKTADMIAVMLAKSGHALAQNGLASPASIDVLRQTGISSSYLNGRSGGGGESISSSSNNNSHTNGQSPLESGWSSSLRSGWSSSGGYPASGASGGETDILSLLGLEGHQPPPSDMANFPMAQAPDGGATAAAATASAPTGFPSIAPPGGESISTNALFNDSWFGSAQDMDWKLLDTSLANSHFAIHQSDNGQMWADSLDDLDMMGPGVWSQPPGVQENHST